MLSAEVSTQSLAELKKNPGKFVGGARLRMAALMSQGDFQRFVIHAREFELAWARLSEHPSLAPIRLPLASGLPLIQGVSITPQPTGPGFLLSITLPAEQMATIKPRLLLIHLQDKVDKLGADVRLNPAQVHCAWYRLVMNKRAIKDYPIGITTEATSASEDTYTIESHRRTGHVEVLFFGATGRPAGQLENLMQAVEEQTRQLAQRPGRSGFYRCFNSQISSALERMKSGYYALGIELPLRVLAGVVHEVGVDDPANPVRDILWLTATGRDAAEAQPALPWFGGHQHRAQQLLSDAGLTPKAPSLPTTSSKLAFLNKSILSQTTREYHQSTICAAQEALHRLNDQQRDFETLTVAIDEAGAEKIKTRITALPDHLPQLQDPPTEILAFLVQLFPLTRVKAEPKAKSVLQLPEGRGGWQKLVLREMVGLDTFRRDPRWIRSKLILPIDEQDIEQALQQLLTANFIYPDPGRGGRLTQTAKNILTPENASGEFLRSYHSLMLNMATQQIGQPSIDRLFLIASFLPSTTTHRPEIIAHAKRFLSDVFEEAGAAMIPDQLYQLGLQCFPVCTLANTLPSDTDSN